ncbi:hypothetical protein MKEN_00888700 [Mycena kentingensis (nom. inval.)]|nr:hypothetical protein MKEN_00888700 [Mycena kentingensis (nom. inval.)]
MVYFELPQPKDDHHPLTMTWDEVNRLQNIRPFLGWKTYPTITYQDFLNAYKPGPVYDRKPGSRKFEHTGVINEGPSQGGYVSVDAGTIIMAPTRLRPGVYQHDVCDAEWKHYTDPTHAPTPRSNYGFYRSVVDLGLEAIGQVWNLFVAMREPMMSGDMRPGILVLARKDYAFKIPPGYRPYDIDWTKDCECSSLVKVCDYTIPDNGCIEFKDHIAHGISDGRQFEVLAGAGDGIYPIEIVRDSSGVVACVKVRFDGIEDANMPDGRDLGSAVAPNPPVAGREPEAEKRQRRRRSAGDMLDVAKGMLSQATWSRRAIP